MRNMATRQVASPSQPRTRRCAAHRLRCPSSPITRRPPDFSTRVISATARSAVANEAKNSHSKHTVKGSIVEWQFFDSPLNELHLCGLDLDSSSLRKGDHFRICIERRYSRTTTGKFRCNRCIATSDVRQSLSVNRASKLDEELLLQRIGNFAKTVRSPPCVGSGQPACQLRAAHAVVRLACSFRSYGPSVSSGKNVRETFDHDVDFVPRRSTPKAEADSAHTNLGQDAHRFQDWRQLDAPGMTCRSR